MKFSIKSFFSKCDQIRSFLRIWSHLLKKSLTENFFFGSAINQPSKCLRFGPYTGENGSAKPEFSHILCSVGVRLKTANTPRDANIKLSFQKPTIHQTNHKSRKQKWTFGNRTCYSKTFG